MEKSDEPLDVRFCVCVGFLGANSCTQPRARRFSTKTSRLEPQASGPQCFANGVRAGSWLGVKFSEMGDLVLFQKMADGSGFPKVRSSSAEPLCVLLRSINATTLRPNGWTTPAAEARFRTGACGCKCLGLASPDGIGRLGEKEMGGNSIFILYFFFCLLCVLSSSPNK